MQYNHTYSLTPTSVLQAVFEAVKRCDGWRGNRQDFHPQFFTGVLEVFTKVRVQSYYSVLRYSCDDRIGGRIRFDKGWVRRKGGNDNWRKVFSASFTILPLQAVFQNIDDVQKTNI